MYIAIIKIFRTQNSGNLLRYCGQQKKVGWTSAINVNPKTAQKEFLTTRKLHNKTKNTQAFHLIQSFHTSEKISPKEANSIGYKLAKSIPGNYEIVIYTHTDRGHIHNHICINSVDFMTGKKLHQTNFKKGGGKKPGDVNLIDIKKESDRLCREKGLSTILDRTSRKRITTAELKLGEKSWKMDLRAAIDQARLNSKNLSEMKAKLRVEGIEMNVRGKNLTFNHPAIKKNIRGKSLGADYTKTAIESSLQSKPEPTAFKKLKEIRLQMIKETDLGKKAELEKQFTIQKQVLEESRQENLNRLTKEPEIERER